MKKKKFFKQLSGRFNKFNFPKNASKDNLQVTTQKSTKGNRIIFPAHHKEIVVRLHLFCTAWNNKFFTNQEDRCQKENTSALGQDFLNFLYGTGCHH